MLSSHEVTSIKGGNIYYCAPSLTPSYPLSYVCVQLPSCFRARIITLNYTQKYVVDRDWVFCCCWVQYINTLRRNFQCYEQLGTATKEGQKAGKLVCQCGKQDASSSAHNYDSPQVTFRPQIISRLAVQTENCFFFVQVIRDMTQKSFRIAMLLENSYAKYGFL